MKHNLFKKKQFLTVCCVLFFSFSISAQKVVYEYDNAGNRIARTVVLPKMQSANKAMKDTTFYKEALGNKEITLYPNPVKTNLNVSISGYEENSTGECVLFDMQGKLILRQKINAREFQIDMSAYNSGNYIMRISVDGEQTTWKVVKQ
jgi:hypothetical protein